jgi:cell division protein FtsZ
MPRIDDFPPHAQTALRAKQAQGAEGGDPAETQAADAAEDKPRMSLLARLAAVGLGRRAEEPEPAAERQPVRHQMPPLPDRSRPILPRAPDARIDPVSEYAKRGMPQGLDQHGRPATVHNHAEDDQLEIPAFLRRQAN